MHTRTHGTKNKTLIFAEQQEFAGYEAGQSNPKVKHAQKSLSRFKSAQRAAKRGYNS